MRFLYGDSTPFPLGYDFLATLAAFMPAATRVVQLELECRQARRGAEEASRLRAIGQGEVERFHAQVAAAIELAAQDCRHPQVLAYSQEIAEFAGRYLEQERLRQQEANADDDVRVRGTTERRHLEQRTALSEFLKVARLPVSAQRIAARWVVSGKSGQYEMSAEYDHPEGIETAFSLVAEESEWNAPRKVAEFAPNTELLVGVEKSWLRGTVTAKQVPVDDWWVVGFALAEDVFEVTLQRKLADEDGLVFRLERSEGTLHGSVESTREASSGALNGTLGAHDTASLERLWQALRFASYELLEQRHALRSVTLDGQDVFQATLVLPLVARLVQTFAPTVHEIAERSPNAFELSLKTEFEDGRREELYLRKEELVQKLQPLSAEGRQVFEPLGLDSWVPSMTADPPPVSLSERTLAPAAALEHDDV